MYMAREVFHCKPGRAKEVVAIFKELSPIMTARGYPSMRVYTDVSAERYWTVVVEQDFQSIDEMAEISRTTMHDPEVAGIFRDYHEYVVGGRRELNRVE